MTPIRRSYRPPLGTVDSSSNALRQTVRGRACGGCVCMNMTNWVFTIALLRHRWACISKNSKGRWGVPSYSPTYKQNYCVALVNSRAARATRATACNACVSIHLSVELFHLMHQPLGGAFHPKIPLLVVVHAPQLVQLCGREE
jgi:hypothetical protein